MTAEVENHLQTLPAERQNIMRTTLMELCDTQDISVWHGNWKWSLTHANEELVGQSAWVVEKDGNCQHAFRW